VGIYDPTLSCDAGRSSTGYFQAPLEEQYEGETAPSACNLSFQASVSPYYHPSRTGMEGLAGDTRAFSTSMEIKAYAGVLLVAP
jgi:hypothetical protein